MGSKSGVFAMEVCGAFSNRIFLFMCACFSGILFALVWRKYEQTVHMSLVHNHYSFSLQDTKFEEWLQKQNLYSELLIEEDVRYSDSGRYQLVSTYLYRQVPVLCLVFVNSKASALAAKSTWASRCNIVKFFGRFLDDEIPVLKVPRLSSFESFCYAFVHVWEKYKTQFEWAIIVDDTTYVLLENLRQYVASLNSSMHYYLGHPVKDFSNFYNLGSAGIVLSHAAMAMLSSTYETSHDCTSKIAPSWYFDQALGKILSLSNVYPVDTRDTGLRGRFNPFPVEKMLIPGSISVFSSYWRTSVYLSEEGHGCCSDNAITFHGNKPPKMYFLEYMLYHLTVFRSSLKGIGNMPDTSENEMPWRRRKPSKKQTYVGLTGEPSVRLISGPSHTKSRKKSKAESILDDIFNEI